MKLRNTPKEYQDYYRQCQINGIGPMAYEKWQVLQNNRKKDNFPSHDPPKKTLWDKIDKDLLFRSQLETRYRPDDCGFILRDDESLSLGNRSIFPRKDK